MDMRRQGNQLEAGLVRMSRNGRMDGYWQGRRGAELISGALTLDTDPLRLPFWLVDATGGNAITAASLTSNVVSLTVVGHGFGFSDYASGILNPGGSNNEVLCTAVVAGEEYNGFEVTLFRASPSLPDLPIEISYFPGATVLILGTPTTLPAEITIAYATDGSGNPSSTAQDIIDAINADPLASAFIVASNSGASTGLGIVTDATTTLSGAVDGPAYLQVEGLTGGVTNPNGIHLVTATDADTLTYPLTGTDGTYTIGGADDFVLNKLADTAVSTILGSCVFSDPSSDDDESIILATNSVAKLVSLRPPYAVTDLPYPSTESLTGAVNLLQCFDRVVLFRDGVRAWEWVPQGRPIISAVLATNEVTVTCRDHGLKVNDVVTLSSIGYATTNPNGSRTVASVTSADVFTFALTAANEPYTANTGKMVAGFFTLTPAGAYTQPETFPMTAADVVVADGLVTADLTTAGLTNATIRAGDFVTVYQSDAALLAGLAGNTYQVVSATTGSITFYAPVGDYNTAATDVFIFGGRFSIGAGFMNMPGAPWGVYFQRRLWVPFWYSPGGTYAAPTYTDKVQHDQIAASDILDPWTYDQIESQFRITAGIADSLVGLQPFYEDALMVLNRNSLHIVAGTQGSLSDTVVKELTREVGCLARKSVVSQGNSVFFLSDNGVYGVGFIEGYNLRGIEEPLSKPIQPLIDRVNKTLASRSVGVYFNNRYYLALPLDSQVGSGDATGNNAVLVFNMLNKGWESLDTFGDGNFNIIDFHIARAEERNDLYAVNEFGGIHRMESSASPVDTLSFDVLGGSSVHAVDSMLQTRSYDFGAQDRKRFSAAQVQCQSDNSASDVVFSFSSEDPDSGSEDIGSIVDYLGSELDPNDTANLRMRLGGLRGFMGTLTISANLSGSQPIGRLKVQSVAVDATMTNRQTLSQH